MIDGGRQTVRVVFAEETQERTIHVDAVKVDGVRYEAEGLRGENATVDIADGGGEARVVIGQGGRTVVEGTEGDDTIDGSGSHDWITGGMGDDVIRGLGGRDVFAIAADAGSSDTILDYRTGRDQIELDAAFTAATGEDTQGGTLVTLESDTGTQELFLARVAWQDVEQDFVL